MSGPAMKWVMSEKDGKTKFADMANEKKWFLACLAWEADPTDNRICFKDGRDIATLAAEAGVSVRAARRYVKAFVDEGVLRPVGRTGYHNRVVVYLFTNTRVCTAAKTCVKRATNDTIQDRSNGATYDTIQADSAGYLDTRNVPNMTVNGANGDTRMVPKMTVNGANGDTHYIGGKELPITSQEKHNAHCRVASPHGRTGLVDFASQNSTLCDAAENVQMTTDNAATKAAAKAMVEAFYGECEANVREEVERGCLTFANQGASVEDMRKAIVNAKRAEKKLARKPRWASVRNALHAIVATRATVMTHVVNRYPRATVDAARAFEAVYERHLAKPAWTSNTTRYALGELFCHCAQSGIDEATFEAACLDVKQQVKDKPPTCRKVRDAIESRKQDGKPFFDRPAERRAQLERDARREAKALFARLTKNARHF